MPEETSKVDNLSDTLYSRTRYKDPLEKRSTMGGSKALPVEDKWQSTPLEELLMRERKENETHPILKKFFIFATCFFIATVVVAGVVFFGGVNFVSSKNVDISVVGPTMVSAGEILELGVTIENKNNTDLELVNFSVNFPQGSRDPKDTTKTLTYMREELGVIKAGDETVRNIAIVLLGSKEEAKEIKFSVEYKVKGSNATFYKEKAYNVTIGNTPLSLTIETPEMVSAGESFDTHVSLTLNSSETIRNVLLRVEYPYGYFVTESSPAAIADNNFWSLGDLVPGVTKKVRIRGKITGENQDERTFRFYIGVGEGGSQNPNFKTILLSSQETVLIERPAVAFDILLNGNNSSFYTASAGKNVSVRVRLRNNLPDKLLNPHLEARIVGNALNKSSVTAEDGGVYSSATGRINWKIIDITGGSQLLPGEDAQAAFSFASLPSTALFGNGQEITLQLTFSGTPVESLTPIVVSETRAVKIASQVTLEARALYSTGSFVNNGPKPPKVGETTTYTIVWKMENTQGTVNNAKIIGRLGSNVKWVAAKSFSNENISYDAKTNTVAWNVGILSPQDGLSPSNREISFQVALVPTLSQVGKAATLITGITFTGIDAETARQITLTNPTLTTALPSDPGFNQGDDIITK